MKKLLFLLVITTSFCYSQEEKRLALVIGNANYDKGALKNPVNDARLIAKTLDSLDFEVLEYYNLKTQRELKNAIRKFGIKRDSADIGFVYYAGHGVQIKNENYLLPTQESFDSEIDIEDYAVSVQAILRYLEAKTNQVNILVLDACRDNPFESKWNTTRSVKGGGLAKVPPPTGSLIAFSTDSGQTAPDGGGENSVYTISLAKNMLLKETSIDQVFRNVRAEVLGLTNNTQRPVESTQLTGKTFYLNTTSYSSVVNKLEQLLFNNNYLDGLSLMNQYELKNNFDSNLYFLRSKIYAFLGKYESAIYDLEMSLSTDSKNPEKLKYKASYEYKIKDFEKSIKTYSKLISNFKFNEDFLKKRSKVYADLNLRNNAINDLLSIRNVKNDYSINELIANQYFVFEEYKKSNTFYQNSIEKLNDGSLISYENKKLKTQHYLNKIAYNFYKLKNLEKSKTYNLESINYGNKCFNCFLNTGIVLLDLKKYKEAIKYFDEALKLNNKNFELFYSRGISYGNIGDSEKAVLDISAAINLKNNNSDLFFQRGLNYFRSEKYNLAIKDYTHAINIKPKESFYYHNRGLCYEEIKNKNSAEKDFLKSIELNPNDYKSYVSLGILYVEKKDLKRAEEYFNLSVIKSKEVGVKYFKRALFNRAIFYYKILQNEKKAIDDLDMSIDSDELYLSAYELKSEILKSIGDNDGYLSLLNKSIELDLKTDLDFNEKKIFRENKNFILRALLFEQLGKPTVALKDYNEAISINFSDPTPHYYLAKFYFRQNNFNESLLSISNAITLLKSFNFVEINEQNKYENIHIDDKVSGYWARISELILLKAFIYKKLNLKRLVCNEISLFEKIIEFSNYKLENSISPSIFTDLKTDRNQIVSNIKEFCKN